MQCHYEVLGVAQDADSVIIKKAHRKLAVKLHPDKNLNDETTAEQFRLVQEAYECLSDPTERQWYDEHRDALLKGWNPNDAGSRPTDMLFDVIPFMHPACYHGYNDSADQNFYQVYGHAFASISKEESDAKDGEGADAHLPFDFGDSNTNWNEVIQFYQAWEGFVSRQSFAWEDQYDVKEAENRRVRRAMEDENKKARKAAKKARNEDVLALVRFVKRRDPRMKALREKQEKERLEKERIQAQELKLKKQQQKEAKEKWQQQAHEHMTQTEEMDRMAGRIRLADLEDDYDYGGGKKKGKKGKKGKKKKQLEESDEESAKEETPIVDLDKDTIEGTTENTTEETGDSSQNDSEEPNSQQLDDDPEMVDNDDEFGEEDEEEIESESESESEEEPDVWRCECCRKDFKSEGQMENHMKSKKHKEAFKKYQKRIEQEMMK